MINMMQNEQDILTLAEMLLGGVIPALLAWLPHIPHPTLRLI